MFIGYRMSGFDNLDPIERQAVTIACENDTIQRRIFLPMFFHCQRHRRRSFACTDHQRTARGNRWANVAANAGVLQAGDRLR